MTLPELRDDSPEIQLANDGTVAALVELADRRCFARLTPDPTVLACGERR
jgi:hypothetical protein